MVQHTGNDRNKLSKIQEMSLRNFFFKILCWNSLVNSSAKFDIEKSLGLISAEFGVFLGRPGARPAQSNPKGPEEIGRRFVLGTS